MRIASGLCPFRLAESYLLACREELDGLIAEAVQDGDEEFALDAEDAMTELEAKLRLLGNWRRDIGAAWQAQMARLERVAETARTFDRLHDLQPGESLSDTSLAVRGGKLVVRRWDAAGGGRAGSVRESELDLWLHVSRYVAQESPPDKAEKRALASYRRIMGKWPEGDYAPDGGDPDPRVADLLRREAAWWREKNRK